MATAVTVRDMQAMLGSFASLQSMIKNIYTQIYVYTQTAAIPECTKGLSSTSSTGPRDDFKPLKIHGIHRDQEYERVRVLEVDCISTAVSHPKAELKTS